MNTLISGVRAGLAATAPMTLVMRTLHHELPSHEKYPLPPQQITSRLANEAGVESHAPSNEGWEWKTHAAHYAYGAGCGAAYALAEKHLPGPTAVKGALFGIGVWTVSYLGWLPAAGILPPAHREPARRNGLMLLAHVVWGVGAAMMLAKKHRR
jgi:uncharacterized membrane protein YagU involved in acid resistance